jgi:hypothetical protein
MHNGQYTWTAVFSWHKNTSFMASWACTEPISGPFLRACILLPRPTRWITVYDNSSSFTPTSFAIWVASLKYTSKHLNSDIWYRAHTYIHHTITTIHVLLYTSSILLGRLAVLHSLYPLHIGCDNTVTSSRQVNPWRIVGRKMCNEDPADIPKTEVTPWCIVGRKLCNEDPEDILKMKVVINRKLWWQPELFVSKIFWWCPWV